MILAGDITTHVICHICVLLLWLNPLTEEKLREIEGVASRN